MADEILKIDIYCYRCNKLIAYSYTTEKNGRRYCQTCQETFIDSDYTRGLKAGVRLYAWWKDGIQYVGTCGTTLKHALERIDKEEDKSDYSAAGGK